MAVGTQRSAASSSRRAQSAIGRAAVVGGAKAHGARGDRAAGGQDGEDVGQVRAAGVEARSGAGGGEEDGGSMTRLQQAAVAGRGGPVGCSGFGSSGDGADSAGGCKVGYLAGGLVYAMR